MDLTSIDIIFLDAGRTLLYLRRGVGEVYSEGAARHGLRVPATDVEKSFFRAFRSKQAGGEVQDRAWWRDVVLRTFAPFGPQIDMEPLFDELHDRFSRPDAYMLLPGAMETVLGLRERGYRTALISNWDARLPAILDALGLTPVLDPIVISERVGAEKPDPLIFQVALAEAGADPERSLMVGDDFAADIRGAAGVGMRSVLIGDGEALPAGGPWTAVPEISGLLDLLPGR